MYCSKSTSVAQLGQRYNSQFPFTRTANLNEYVCWVVTESINLKKKYLCYLSRKLNLLSVEMRSYSCWIWARPGKKISTAPSMFLNWGFLSAKLQYKHVVKTNMHCKQFHITTGTNATPCG